MLESYNDVEVIGEAGNGLEAGRTAELLRPGIVGMDINMSTMNGIEARREVTARHPNIIVIGLSMNTADYHHNAMTRAGAAMLLRRRRVSRNCMRPLEQWLSIEVRLAFDSD